MAEQDIFDLNEEFGISEESAVFSEEDFSEEDFTLSGEDIFDPGDFADDEFLIEEEPQRQEVAVRQPSEFAPRQVRFADIEGFEGMPRTDSIIKNAGLDIMEIANAYGILFTELYKNPLTTLGDIAENFGPAMVTTYKRWGDAIDKGVFLEAAAAHPLQLIQDMTLPVSLFMSGGATGASLLGKAPRFARSMSKIAKYTDVVAAVTDPISSIPVIALRKTGGLALNKMTGRNLKREIAQSTGISIDDIPESTDAVAKSLDDINKPLPFDKDELRSGFDVDQQLDEGGDFLFAGKAPEATTELRVQDVIQSEGKPFKLPEQFSKLEKDANEFLRVDPRKLPKSFDWAGNLNLKNMGLPEWEKRMLKFIVEAQNDGLINSRHTRTISQIQAESAKLQAISNITGHNANDISPSVFKAYSAEELDALGAITKRSIEDTTVLSQIVREGSNSDLELMKFVRSYNETVQLTSKLTGARSEAGRALRILREIPNTSGFNSQIMEELLSTQGGRAKVEMIAKDLGKIQGKGKYLEEALNPTTWDKFQEVRINGMLSGPQTMIINPTSNAGMVALNQFETGIAAGLSKIPFFGSGKLGLDDVTARTQGLVDGFRRAATKGFATFWTEETPDILGQLEVARRQAIGGKLGKAVRLPGRVLEGQDIFFKYLNAQSELWGIANREYKKALKKGEVAPGREFKTSFIKKFTDKPEKKFWNEAWQEARRLTFTKELGGNWISDLGKLAQSAANRNKLVKLIIPFIRTPTNILEETVKRTPLGLTLKDTRKALLGKASIQRDQAWARMLIGTGVGLGSMYAAHAGFFTGGAPSDRNERELKIAGGWQEYSVKVGDTYLSYNRTEPIGTILGVASDFYRLNELMTNDELAQIPTLIANSIFKNIGSKTFFRGVMDANKAFTEPDKYMDRWAQNMAASTIPFSSAVATIARVEDPFMRESTNIFERAQARGFKLFGDRDELPARRNLWGEPIEFETDVKQIPFAGKYFDELDEEQKSTWRKSVENTLRAINPFYMRTDKNDKVTNFMNEIGYFPGLPSKTMLGVKLTGEQHNDLVRIAGESSKAILDKYANTDEWDRAVAGSLEDRVWIRDYIESVIQAKRRDAREMLRHMYPELDLAIEKKREVR